MMMPHLNVITVLNLPLLISS